MSEEAEAAATTAEAVAEEVRDAVENVPQEEAPAEEAAAAPEGAAEENPAAEAPPVEEESVADPPPQAEEPPAATEEALQEAPVEAAPVEEAPATEAPAAAEEPTTDAPAVGGGDMSDVAQIPATLHVAARSGNIETVKMLLRNGADPHHTDTDGKTALEVVHDANHTEEVMSELKGILVSAMKPPLHAAASSGNIEAVKKLLRDGADPHKTCPDGKTALDMVHEAGHAEEVMNELKGILAAAMKPPSEPPAEAPAAAEEPPPQPAAEQPAAVPEPAPPTEEAAPAPAPEPAPVAAPDPAPAAADFEDPPQKPPNAGMASTVSDFRRADDAPKMSRSASESGLGGHRKRDPLGAAPLGVLTRTPHMVSFSRFESSPKWTMRIRGPGGLVKNTYTPAPGAYELPSGDKVKFKSAPKFGFGTGSRFGMGESLGGGANRDQPGPGQYTPQDPALTLGTRVGFGTSIRQGPSSRIRGPGPGTYEFRSSMGTGPMFTAKGKQPTSYLKKSGSGPSPGPGAYSLASMALEQGPKCGFGTSSRDAEIRRMGGTTGDETGGNPGPGAYDVQTTTQLGTFAPKFSITSRRRMHDLNSYMSPGPGAYNSSITSFGY